MTIQIKKQLIKKVNSTSGIGSRGRLLVKYEFTKKFNGKDVTFLGEISISNSDKTLTVDKAPSLLNYDSTNGTIPLYNLKLKDLETFKTNGYKTGIKFSDEDKDTVTLTVTPTNNTNLEAPQAGSVKEYEFNVKIEDKYGQKGREATRKVVVSNLVPEIKYVDPTTKVETILNGINGTKPTIVVAKGTIFDLKNNIVVTDKEYVTVTNVTIPVVNTATSFNKDLTIEATDSDGNKQTGQVNVIVNAEPTIEFIDNSIDFSIKNSKKLSNDTLKDFNVKDDHDKNININNVKITGTINVPSAGITTPNKITYNVTDSMGSTATIDRNFTTTNYLPEFSGINNVKIIKGTDFDLQKDVIASDYEYKVITDKVIFPTETTATLGIGEHKITYKVTDEDNNVVEKVRTITVKEKPPVVVPPPVNPPTDSDNNNGGSDNENNNGENNNTPVAPPIVDGGITPTTPPSDNNGGNTENLPATQEDDKNNNQVADSQNKEESNNSSNNSNDTIISADNTGDFSHSGEKTPGTNTNSITNGFISWWWLILIVIAFIAYKIYKKYKDDKELDMDIEV